MTNEELDILDEFLSRVWVNATEVNDFVKVQESLRRERLINNKLETDGPKSDSET